MLAEYVLSLSLMQEHNAEISYLRVYAPTSVVTPYDNTPPTKPEPQEPVRNGVGILVCRLGEGHFKGLDGLVKSRNAPRKGMAFRKKTISRRPTSPRALRNFL